MVVLRGLLPARLSVAAIVLVEVVVLRGEVAVRLVRAVVAADHHLDFHFGHVWKLMRPFKTFLQPV